MRSLTLFFATFFSWAVPALVFTAPLMAFAVTLPDIGISNLMLDQQNLRSGDAVTGSFDIKNNEPVAESTIGYEIILTRGGSNATGGAVMNISVPTTEWVTIGQQSSVHKMFTYLLPQNVTAGTYQLSVRAVSATGAELGSSFQIIAVASSNKAITLTNAQVAVQNKTLGADGARPAVFPSDTPKASFTIDNSAGAAPVELTPSITIHKGYAGGVQMSKTKAPVVTVAAHGKKPLTLALPVFTAPGSYIAEVALVDTSGNPVSNLLYFSWTIIGQSGKILFVTPLSPNDIAHGQYCSTVPVRITYAPPADGTTNNGPYTISLAVSDALGASLGSASGSFDEKVSDAVFSVPITACVKAPQIRATLAVGGMIVDTYSIGAAGSAGVRLPGTSAPMGVPSASPWAIAIVAVILVTLFVFALQHKSLKSLIIAFMFAGAIFSISGQSAHAAFSCGPGLGTTAGMPADHLIAYYPLDASTFNWTNKTIADTSGNGYTLTAEGLTSANVRTAVINEGINLPASGSDGVITSRYGMPPTLSVATWINETAGNGPGVEDVVGIGTGDVVVRSYWAGDNNAHCKYYIGPGGGGTDGDWNSLKLTNANFLGTGWHHITCIFDTTSIPGKTVVTGYVDGVNKVSQQFTQPINYTYAGATISRIGSGSGQFYGTLDDVRIYNRVLTDGEVWQLANPVCSVPTATFSASPATIIVGQSTSLNWTSANTTPGSCTSPDFPTGGATAGSVPVSPGSTTTYHLTCTGPGGTTPVYTATVTVNPPPVTATLTANPSSIDSGSSSKLTWTSSNATNCTGTGFSTGGALNNSTGVSVSPTTNTTYSLTCTGPGGTYTANAPVAVTCQLSGAGASCTSSPNVCGMTSGSYQCISHTDVCVPPSDLACPAPTAAIIATPALVVSGSTITVTWNSSDTKNCSVSASDSFTGTGVNGSGTDGPITQMVTYTLQCQSVIDNSWLTARSKVGLKPHVIEI